MDQIVGDAGMARLAAEDRLRIAAPLSCIA
jgi:hypothetical protein